MRERRAQILNLVAEAYIDSAHPVPSAVIAERLEVSSATIRNEFIALEQEGLLQQPHTSAGRIPTARGFQTYAEAFLPPRPLPQSKRRWIRQVLGDATGDTLLLRLAQLAADLSGYPVIVTLPADDSLHALEIHLSRLASTRLLAVAVLQNGLLRQLTVQLEEPPTDEVLDAAEGQLRQLTLPLAEVPMALRSLASRTCEELSAVLRALALGWDHLSPPRRFTNGLTRLLEEPESRDPDFMRQVLQEVETPALREIGLDTPLLLDLDGALARIVARLYVGSLQGDLVLVGPARMRYREALMIARGVTEAVAQQNAPAAS